MLLNDYKIIIHRNSFATIARSTSKWFYAREFNERCDIRFLFRNIADVKLKSMSQWMSRLKPTTRSPWLKSVELARYDSAPSSLILKRFMNYPNSNEGWKRHDEFTLDWTNRSFTPFRRTIGRMKHQFLILSPQRRRPFLHFLCEWIIEKEFLMAWKTRTEGRRKRLMNFPSFPSIFLHLHRRRSQPGQRS